MNGKHTFFDTNVVVYAYDLDAPAKQAIAQNLLDEMLGTDAGVISAQVLGEFFHAAVTRKKLMTAERAQQVIDDLSVFRTEALDGALVRAAITVHRKYGLRYWDALIVATAKRAGCDTVFSEDMNPGQDYDGVRVVNPFAGV